MQKLLLPAVLALFFTGNAAAQTASSLDEVYKIFKNRCASCHKTADPAGGLDLEGTGANDAVRALNVAGKIVSKNPQNAHAISVGDKLVYPGRPDRSFLFRKLNEGFEPTIAALHANEGDNMPGTSYVGEMLPAEKEIVRQWILYGAKLQGAQFDKAMVEDWYANGGLKSFPDGPPPAPAASEGFQIKMGPFFLSPDGEVEYYLKHELKLPADIEVARIDMKIAPYSHHLLIYNFGSTAAANQIPAGLRLNANHSDINLVSAIQEETDLRLPAGTAFKWKKDIVLDLNSHYINYSSQRPFACEAYINVYTQPVGTAQQEMKAALLVNLNIPVPNNGNVITHTASENQFGADSIYIWGMSGHTHKYGVSYKVWKRLPNGQKGEQVYDASCFQGEPGCISPSYDYQHIPLRYWFPLLPIKWSNGIIHEAKWVNDGPSTVNFGPTSDDEMMVLIVFYTEQPVTVSSPEIPEISSLEISPNPATDFITFSLSGNKPAETLQVFDVSGRAVFRKDNIGQSEFSIDLKSFPPGIYLFNLDGVVGRFAVGKER